jgi:hypothetical protein
MTAFRQGNLGAIDHADPKQWDGLPLPERAPKCQTGVSTQPVMRKVVNPIALGPE